MLAQTLRASRSSIARVARQQMVTKRTFITPTAVRRADIVQDLYVRELKAYKVPAVKASDAEGNVQIFSAPKAPVSPEETDIANELKAYEASAVEVEGQVEGEAAEAESSWFEEEPEEEEAHH